MEDYRRILLIKPSSLGDIVHALPAVSALRTRFPCAHITWLVKRQWAEILEGNPDVDEVLAVDFRVRDWLSIIARLRRSKFDLAVDLQGLIRSGLLGFLSGAPERVGFAAGREGSPFFYTQRVRLASQEPKNWRLFPMHAVERNLMVAAHLGADIRSVRFPLPAFSDDEKQVDSWLQGAGIREDEKLVAIAPVDRLGVRSWPLDRFVAVAAALSRNPCVRIVLIGTSGQRWVAEQFLRPVGSQLVDLVGETRVRQLSVLFRRMHLVISNDSAPMHIAAAVGTPVLGLFGPSNSNRARPLGEQHAVLRTELPCSPCGLSICKNRNHLECLTSIEVDDVVRKAEDMLRRNGEPRGSSSLKRWGGTL